MGFRGRCVLPAILGLVFALWLGSANLAKADQVGVLECRVSPGIGYLVTSSRTLACRFNRVNGWPEYYVGAINKYGLALGATTAGELVWEVYAATPEPGRYALAGQYGGPSAELTFGVGLGANALVGGNHGSIALQPLSVNGQFGVNIAAGIGSLTLQPAYYGRRHYRHHHSYQHY
jgi:hypothetical protein